MVQQVCISQNGTTDSLKRVLQHCKEDKVKLKTLNALSIQLFYTNIDSGLVLGKQALELAKKIGIKKEIAANENLLGNFYFAKGDYGIAVDHFNNALNIWEELIKSPDKKESLNAKQYKAVTIGNIGSVYNNQGNYPKALDCYLKALKMADELDLKEIESGNLNNIGIIYQLEGDYKKALDYFTQTLILEEELGDQVGIAGSLHNIAVIYFDQNNFQKAIDYDFKALKIGEKLGLKQLQSDAFDNLGSVYSKMGDSIREKTQNGFGKAEIYLKAKNYLLLSLTIRESIGDKSGISNTLGSIALLYSKTKKFKEAEESLKRALSIATEIKALNVIRDLEKYLYQLYSAINKPLFALEHYKKYVEAKDSINSEENQKQQVITEMNFEFNKKEIAAKAEQDKKDNFAMEEKQRQRLALYFVIAGSCIVLFFSFFLYRRFKITQRQKIIIEKQKHLVEIQQKEMIDSITYAKRLQEAILPPIELIKKHLPQSFVLYKPKAIVAGDFYWMEYVPAAERAEGKKVLPLGEDLGGDVLLIAAADCTGHGVPGAIVSVVCSNALNRSVKEFNLTDTGKILDKTRELVLETFEKSSSEVKDGMDISLLSIDKKNRSIFWSGANNPLWYIHDNVLTEIKGNKQPIGKTDHTRSFTTHQIEYKENTIFYLFTDGLADQFGGPKGKKFKYKQFSGILSTNNNLTLLQQSEIIDRSFNDWKGNLEQVDDICIIGIRI